MELWDGYMKFSNSDPDFGSKAVFVGTKERDLASLSSVESRARKLDINKFIGGEFDRNGARYIIAQSLTFDVLVLLYDVNTTKTLALRILPGPVQKETIFPITGFIKGLKRKNLELRMIGLQNGNKDARYMLDAIRDASKASLTELDIFGNQTRHICFDMKTGMAYNLLLENRHYRPGELNNTTTFEQFIMVQEFSKEVADNALEKTSATNPNQKIKQK